MTDIPAGWYDDPEYPAHHRYWDGGQWTEHRAPRTPPPPPRRSDSAWNVVSDLFSLIARCWRGLLLITVPMVLAIVAGLIVVYLAFDAALSPGLGEILDRITEPGFDTGRNLADYQFMNSIELDIGPGTLIGLFAGGITILTAMLTLPLLVFVHLASALSGQAVSAAETYRRTVRRLPRVIALYLLWLLGSSVVIAAALLVIVLLAWVSLLTLLVTIPTALAGMIFLWPYGYIAVSMLVLAPRGTPLLSEVISLLRHRWPAVAGRVLALNVVVIAITAALNTISIPLGPERIGALLVAGILVQSVQYVILISGSVVIYDWAGGPLDPSLRGDKPT
jgi:uncharacterized membrane protein YccF (DUF307 family)